MLRSVFAKTLRDARFAIAGWSVLLFVLSSGMVLFFPAMSDLPDLSKLVGALPAPFQAMIGDLGAMNLIEGFLRIKFFQNLPVMLGIFAMLAGADAIAGERERGTLDLLLAQPIQRWRVLLEKGLALSVGLVVLSAVGTAGLMFGIQITGIEASRANLALAVLVTIPAGLVFGALGLLGSCIFAHARRATALAGLVMGISYLVYVLGQGSSRMQPLLRLSIFEHYQASLPLLQPLRLEPVIGQLLAALLLTVAAVIVLERSDLRS